jgi:hypothetical protein
MDKSVTLIAATKYRKKAAAIEKARAGRCVIQRQPGPIGL